MKIIILAGGYAKRMWPLTEEETAGLLARASHLDKPEQWADALFERSEGNPLFAIELIRSGRVEVASMVSSVMPLEKLNEAFRKLEKAEEMVILIQP